MFCHSAHTSESQKRCAIVFKDNELEIFKKIGFEAYTPDGFYSRDTTYFDLDSDYGDSDHGEDINETIDETIAEIKKCVRRGEKVNLFVFAHTNNYPLRIIEKLQADAPEVNIADTFEFIYNSGCGNGGDGDEITSAGVPMYIGHGLDGVSCSPNWLGNFLPKLEYANSEGGLLHAVAQANHMFDPNDCLSIIRNFGRSGRNRLLSDDALPVLRDRIRRDTQAFVKVRPEETTVDAFRENRLSSAFPLASNLNPIRSALCVNLKMYLDRSETSLIRDLERGISLNSSYGLLHSQILKVSNLINPPIKCGEINSVFVESFKNLMNEKQSGYFKKQFECNVQTTVSFECKIAGSEYSQIIRCNRDNKIEMTYHNEVNQSLPMERLPIDYSDFNQDNYLGEIIASKWISPHSLNGRLEETVSIPGGDIKKTFIGKVVSHSSSGASEGEELFQINQDLSEDRLIFPAEGVSSLKSLYEEAYRSRCSDVRPRRVKTCPVNPGEDDTI